MISKTKIVYYAFPFHIDMIERTILQLKRASNYANTKKYLCLDIVLDISNENFEWDKCNIPKQFFIDKFKYLEKYCDFCLDVNFRVDDTLKSSGAHQRQVLKENNGEYNLIWLDPDIYFPIEIFYLLENIVPNIEKDTLTYMVTPQIAKFWDSSWDIISNEKYINSSIEFDNINVYELDSCDVDSIELIKNYNHKFAGGWFNFHSKELTKLMVLPDKKGYDIPQYIIKNCIILEDRKYYHKNDFWTKYIPLKPGSSGYSQDPDKIFQEVKKELIKLHNE